jgi:XisH protein
MSAKDKFHDLVKTALQKDGWAITADFEQEMIAKWQS